MNPRRRQKSLLPGGSDDPTPRPKPLPMSRRRRPTKAIGSARSFADFLAAAMTLPPEQLDNLE